MKMMMNRLSTVNCIKGRLSLKIIPTSLTPCKRLLSSSVSQEEVSKFSSMAAQWWDPKYNPLISMNPIRMSFIIQTLQKHHQQARILQNSQHSDNNPIGYKPFNGFKALDVGCGGGLLSESLARLGATVTAIDPSIDVANEARLHSQRDPDIYPNISYKGGMSVEELATEYNEDKMRSNDNLFDIVCILEVIEHATDPQSLVKSASSLLKKPDDNHPGGMMFISTINRTAKSFLVAIVGAEYVTRKIQIGTHSYDKFKSPLEVERIVNQNDLKPYAVSGMVLKPPFYDLRWYLDPRDTDINWIGAYHHIKS